MLSTGRIEEDNSIFVCPIGARRIASILDAALSSLALKTAFAMGFFVRNFRTCSVVVKLANGIPEAVGVAAIEVTWLLGAEKTEGSSSFIVGGTVNAVEALDGIFETSCSPKRLTVEGTVFSVAEVDPFEEHAARKAALRAVSFPSSSAWCRMWGFKSNTSFSPVLFVGLKMPQ